MPPDFQAVAVAFGQLVEEHKLPLPVVRAGPLSDCVLRIGENTALSPWHFEVRIGVPQPIDMTVEARARILFASYVGMVAPERLLELLDRVQALEKNPRGALFCQWCGRHRRTGKPASP